MPEDADTATRQRWSVETGTAILIATIVAVIGLLVWFVQFGIESAIADTREERDDARRAASYWHNRAQELGEQDPVTLMFGTGFTSLRYYEVKLGETTKFSGDLFCGTAPCVTGEMRIDEERQWILGVVKPYGAPEDQHLQFYLPSDFPCTDHVMTTAGLIRMAVDSVGVGFIRVGIAQFSMGLVRDTETAASLQTHCPPEEFHSYRYAD